MLPVTENTGENDVSVRFFVELPSNVQAVLQFLLYLLFLELCVGREEYLLLGEEGFVSLLSFHFLEELGGGALCHGSYFLAPGQNFVNIS